MLGLELISNGTTRVRHSSQFIFDRLFLPGLGEFQHFVHGVEDTLRGVVVVLELRISLLVDDICQKASIRMEEENSKSL